MGHSAPTTNKEKVVPCHSVSSLRKGKRPQSACVRMDDSSRTLYCHGQCWDSDDYVLRHTSAHGCCGKTPVLDRFPGSDRFVWNSSGLPVLPWKGIVNALSAFHRS